MASVIMNAKCTADHDSPDSMLPRELCLICNPRKRQTAPTARHSRKSDGVTLAPPLSIYKALQADLADETDKAITQSAEEAMGKAGPKELALRAQREAIATKAPKSDRRKSLKKIIETRCLAVSSDPALHDKLLKQTPTAPQTAGEQPKESAMPVSAKKTTKTAKKTAAKSSARKAVKSTAARTTTATKERKTYDWKGAAENAAKGIVPTAPDFSANTHRFYREPLAEAVKLVKAGDLKALAALKFTRDDGSPGMIKRYRDIAVIALKAKK